MSRRPCSAELYLSTCRPPDHVGTGSGRRYCRKIVIPESEEYMSEKKCYGVNPRSKQADLRNHGAFARRQAPPWLKTNLIRSRADLRIRPQGARPRVWWHWMNGNITKEGIKLDLEWMHRVGLGGFQNFDAALATPQVVDNRLVYMTPEWKDAFKYATTLADRSGTGRGDCRFAGLERVRRSVGASLAGNEEVCVECDLR